MSFLFVFRVAPDIDHIAPLAWKLLDEGETVHVLLSPGTEPDADHRLRFLMGFERFHVHRVQGRLRGSLLYVLFLLARHRVRAVGVEWGNGLPAGYDDLRKPTGWAAVARSLVNSLGAAADPHQPRMNAMVAARLLRRPVVCLPHGLSIKLDAATNDELARALEAGTLDHRDRNRFAAYVLNTEHHRQIEVEHAHGDPRVMQAWGSLRWAPEWFERNRALVDPWTWPADAENRLKVVLMAPKWINRVHTEAAIDLVARIQDLDYVSLAVKGHPRLADRDDPLRADPRIRYDEFLDVAAIDSVALIAAADVVLDVGSSIGLEVVLQDTLLINPTYIHELKTLFDDIPGSCVTANDADEVVAALEAAAAGRPQPPDPAALRELMRRAVYADRDEPFDVPGFYVERIRAIAAG